MAEQHRKSSRLTWALAGATVVALLVLLAVVFGRGFEQARLIDEIEAKGGQIVFIEGAIPEWVEDRLPASWFHRLRRMFGQIESVSAGGEWFDDGIVMRASGFLGVPIVHFEDASLTDRGVETLASNPHLRWLHLTRCRIGDAGLAHLSAHNGLTVLLLDGTQVTDVGLAHLAMFSTLELLNLDDTTITDAGFAQLSKVKPLEGLSVQRCNVTAAGLESLVGLPRLKYLWLSGARLGDDVEPVLLRMPALKYVNLRDTFVSTEVIDRLRKNIASVEGP
ncbi:MAG: hypothetical protein WED34_18295 [Planctomycetales bacterium]